jgi:hypothetical protein
MGAKFGPNNVHVFLLDQHTNGKIVDLKVILNHPHGHGLSVSYSKPSDVKKPGVVNELSA